MHDRVDIVGRVSLSKVLLILCEMIPAHGETTLDANWTKLPYCSRNFPIDLRGRADRRLNIHDTCPERSFSPRRLRYGNDCSVNNDHRPMHIVPKDTIRADH